MSEGAAEGNCSKSARGPSIGQDKKGRPSFLPAFEGSSPAYSLVKKMKRKAAFRPSSNELTLTSIVNRYTKYTMLTLAVALPNDTMNALKQSRRTFQDSHLLSLPRRVGRRNYGG